MQHLGTAIPSESKAFGSAAVRSLGVALLFALAAAPSARADDLPRAVALPPHTQEPARDAALSRELDRALLQLGVFELLPRPAFDLEAVQLTIDCVEESVECLRQVAERTQAQIVIAPTVERSNGALVLSLLYFDSKTGTAPRKVARKQRGDELDRDTFDALPALLRQLLPNGRMAAAAPKPSTKPAPLAPAPTAEPKPEPPEAEPDTEAESTAETEAALAAAEEPVSGPRPFPVGPVILGAGGLALLATGAVFGALVSSAEQDYSNLQIRTADDAMRAESDIDSGETKALVANVLLGAGAAVVVGAAVWLAIDLSSNREPADVAVVPVIGKDYAGLSLSGRLGARQ